MSQSPHPIRLGLATPRTAWVDVAKALCIVLVVMMHSTHGLQNAVGAEGFLGPVVAFFAPFRIPTFFVLSGLFLARALERRFGDYLSTRIAHFAYFYLLWLAIQVALRSGAQLLGAPQDVALKFLFALVEPHDALWFLHLLIVFSLVAFALRRVSLPIVLAAAALLYLLRVETGSNLIDEFTGRAVFFAAGWALSPLFFALAKRAVERPLLSAAAIAAFAACNAAVVFLLRAEHVPLLGLALGFAGAGAMVLVAALLAAVPRVGSMAAALGRHSLEIYVAFTLPMAAARSALLAAGVVQGGWIGVGLASLFITIVAIVTPLVVARAVRGTMLGFLFERPGQPQAAGARPAGPSGAPRRPASA